ncbi:acyltransferase [Thalassotalea nanhaiensis]|uniref:Acyltransferase n=1 Tax=Thalassotalea nanhaiensis TaxID=3065648 RepID=A0ABY9TLQ2_9GAMM|nr:acyltransferase [Colwelliaceae bacterium SQ345]
MKRLELLDYGRFFAAIMVVVFHYTLSGITNGKIFSISQTPMLIEITKYGYLGVELFFMISGYVIFFSAKDRTASEFAIGRVIRLYPSYWFAVLFTSAFAAFWGGNIMSVSPVQILVNFSMVQSLFGVAHIDGVYWTLIYELIFYFAVFLLLLLGLQRYLRVIFICWPILFCIAYVFDIGSLPYVGNYFYYFSAGTIFALLADRFSWRACLSLIIVFVFCIVFSTGKVDSLSASKGVQYSSFTIALIVSSFFMFFVYQNSQKGKSLKLPMSKLAGALTYPIYLIHAHFGFMFLNKFATNNNKILMYILTFLIVLLVSAFMHLVIERRLYQVWKYLFVTLIGKPIQAVQNILLKLKNTTNNLCLVFGAAVKDFLTP